MAIRHVLLRSMTALHVVLVHTQYAHEFAMALVSNMTASHVVLAHAQHAHIFATTLVSK